MASPDRLDAIVSLSKRRGMVFPSSEIYGGLRASWDYGPLGVELKNNVKREWWRSMVQGRDDVVGLDSSVILAREVWETSGHVEAFVDPLVECQACHKRFRADHLEEEKGKALAEIACPNCGTRGAWTEPKQFNGLLRTYLGPVEDESGLAYLRPETAQGIFINFANVMSSARRKPPFGIGQIGKSFRNEITPGNFIFRTREFEQMEMEFFVPPGTDEEWHQYWIDERLKWYTDLGIAADNLRLYEHPQEKLSHYSKRTVDVEYRFQFAGSEWGELEGVANRTDYDLTRAQQAERGRPVLLRPGDRRALGAVRHRAGGGCRPRHAGVPARRLCGRRGAQHQGRGRQAHGAAARSAARAGEGGRAAALARQRALADRQERRDRSCASAGTSTSTTPVRSGGATGARTRSARRSR